MSELVVNARFTFSCINSHSSKYLLTRCTLISKLRYDFMRFTNGFNWGNNKRHTHSFVSRQISRNIIECLIKRKKNRSKRISVTNVGNISNQYIPVTG